MAQADSGRCLKPWWALLLVGQCAFPALAAGENLFALQGDFGGVGLLQTPTARMADAGQFAVNYMNIDPYSNFSVSVQPLAWLQFGFRYTSIDNRDYDVANSDIDALDKGVGIKLRLLGEGRYLPAVALGFRDLGGTGLFSSEYLVASKRWYDLDFSIGVATGYLGAGGDINNPLGAVDDHFDERRTDTGGDFGGEFALKQWFTGEFGFFGGVAYQTPWNPLVLMAEYDGNDYQSEPRNNNQEQDSPINFGARYRVNDFLTLSAGWERGNTAMLGVTLSVNLAELSQPKQNPAPVPANKHPPPRMPQDWGAVTRELAQNAGIQATRILRQEHSLIVEGMATKYRSLPETELRANRILHNHVPADISLFKYRWKEGGLYLREDTLPRSPLPQEPFIAPDASQFAEQDYRHGVVARGMSPARVEREDGEVLFEAPWRGFSYDLAPGLQMNYGGPDGYLYAVFLQLEARLWTDDHGFVSATLGYDLLGNFEDYQYLAPSKLPRVRSFIGEYLQQADLGVYNLQYTRTARLGKNWFALGYAGFLEMMYGGVGGEVLYRAFNSPLAVGLDINWVKQRDFDVLFGFRDYDTVTGHLTSYWETGFKNVLATVSVGRYLAQDWGATLDLSRRFASGVRLGAWATFTDAGDAYGEGGFDKGIYISIPWDAFFTQSTRNHATLVWDPLTRDGGARLHRSYGLYGMTHDRALGPYWQNYEDDQ